MDSKKKRNKKKKGNQGKNTVDVISNAGEAAPQHHNHELAPRDHYKGSGADDAMSSVGEGVPQYQNHEPTLQSDRNGTNGHDTTSSVGEGIRCYQNNEPTLTQENHKDSNAVPADQRSIGMSESSVELDMHRLYEAKLDKLHETIKQLEDEKSLWLQKVSAMESELEKLHSKVDLHMQNEVLLDGKLNSLQIGYDVLIKKEEVLCNKVMCIDDINGTLTRHEALLKERFSELEETNKTLVAQVSDNKVMDPMNFAGPLLHQQTADFTEGNELIAERGLSSSVEITPNNSYSLINNTTSNAYASNHPEETSIRLPEISISNSIAQAHVNEHEFDGPTSEEIVPIPLDDIQIHEDDPRQPGVDDEIDEVPFSDAPIIGAPFRLISFVARYVSGADLVNQK
ncbi:unnamed protein product [Urochloa decumbens]|uniref:Uncharacterized protein n=1 Tax=Urochloa decumbens TaxID=240449 RepID=A0ABC8XBZ1_9POAL